MVNNSVYVDVYSLQIMDNVIAVFDFDGTIICHDSMWLFLSHAIGKLRMVMNAVIMAPQILLAKIRLADLSSTKERLLIRCLRNLSSRQLQDLGQSFAKRIESDISPEISRRMEMHHIRGDKVWIVSASMSFWIEPWAKNNAIDKVIATKPKYDSLNGYFAGFASANCKGIEKVRRIQGALAESNISRESVSMIGYGNSSDDYEMLDFCNKSFIIDRDDKIFPYK